MHKQMTLAVLQPKIKTNPNFHHEWTIPDQSIFYIINLVVKNKEGGAEGRLKIPFFPWKGSLIREGGGLIEDLG